MLKRFSGWIQKVLCGRAALFSLLLFAFFLIFILPAQAGKNEAVGSPDLSFTYSADDIYRMAESYGAQGRLEYIRVRWTFDLVWPLVYTLGLCAGISLVFRRAFPPASCWQLSNLAPVLGAVFDYLENSAATLVMAGFPDRALVAGLLAPLFTMVKWLFVCGSFGLIILGALVWIWQVVRRKHLEGGG